MKRTAKEGQAAIDDDVVAEYLAANGDFFARRPDLLPDLTLPGAAEGQQPGEQTAQGVVPLVERQVSVLRRRNTDLRGRMTTLIAHARDNDRIFADTRAFALALMDVVDFASLNNALRLHLVGGFKLDHAACLLNGRVTGGDLEHIVGVAGEAPLPRLFDQTEPTCGVYRAEEYGRLFPGANLTDPGSVALVPLDHRDGRAAATLAMGDKDPLRFAPNMGKVFLSFLGESVSRTLARLERSAGSG